MKSAKKSNVFSQELNKLLLTWLMEAPDLEKIFKDKFGQILCSLKTE